MIDCIGSLADWSSSPKMQSFQLIFTFQNTSVLLLCNLTFNLNTYDSTKRVFLVEQIILNGAKPKNFCNFIFGKYYLSKKNIQSTKIIQIEQMGCQNSRLSLITNQSVQKNPQSGSTGQSMKPKSKSKIYEDKQNIDELQARKKDKTPQAVHIITNDGLKGSAQGFSKEQLQMVAEVVKKIEDLQCSGKAKRRQHLKRANTQQQYQEYFTQVLTIIKQRQSAFQKIFQQARQKYHSTFGKRLKQEDIDRIVQQYLSQNVVPYFEAQKWVKEKVVILRIKRQSLTKWTKIICSNWKSDKQHIPEILHYFVEDSIPTERSFGVKLAIQYEYKNILEQLKEWQTEITQLYLQLRQVII